MTEDLPSEHQIDSLFESVGTRPFEVFFEVVNQGGFSRAADSINLTQPTVSQHVKKLEETLGTSLIVRSDGEISLTPLGEVCYEKIKSMNAAKDDLKEAVKSYFERGSRRLNIAASTIPGEFILPLYLSDFLSANPEVQINFTVDDSQAILNQLDNGDVRWGVTGSRSDHSALNFEALLSDEMVLVGRGVDSVKEVPLDYRNFNSVDYVGRSRESGTQQAVEERFREAGASPQRVLDPVARLGTIQAVRTAVLGGLGVSFLPVCAVRHDLTSGRLEQIPTTFPPIERIFYGVKNRFLGLPPIVETFKRFLKDTKQRVES